MHTIIATFLALDQDIRISNQETLRLHQNLLKIPLMKTFSFLNVVVYNCHL